MTPDLNSEEFRLHLDSWSDLYTTIHWRFFVRRTRDELEARPSFIWWPPQVLAE